MLHGLVAQLGAHHIRIVGVEGSNPFKSTKRKATSDEVAFFLVQDLRRRDSNNLIRLAGGKPGGECPPRAATPIFACGENANESLQVHHDRTPILIQ